MVTAKYFPSVAVHVTRCIEAGSHVLKSLLKNSKNKIYHLKYIPQKQNKIDVFYKTVILNIMINMHF